GGCHLIPRYRGEVLAHALLDGRGVVIDLTVVFGSDRQLDTFACNGQTLLPHGGVAWAGVGKGVDVGVAADVPLGRHLAADRQRLADNVAEPDRNAGGVNTHLEAPPRRGATWSCEQRRRAGPKWGRSQPRTGSPPPRRSCTRPPVARTSPARC